MPGSAGISRKVKEVRYGLRTERKNRWRDRRQQGHWIRSCKDLPGRGSQCFYLCQECGGSGRSGPFVKQGNGTVRYSGLGWNGNAGRHISPYRAAKEAYDRFGSLDCWINNVGASFPKEGEEYREQDIEKITKVCFFSTIYGTQAAFRYMKKTGGSIINISSLAARCGTVGASTLYGPLKSAVIKLAVSFAGEYAAYGVRVNSVLPGFTATPAVAANIKPDYLKRNADDTLLRRVAVPEEIAAPVVFLCSSRASYITGTSLEVSGGRSIVLNPEYSYVKKEGEQA